MTTWPGRCLSLSGAFDAQTTQRGLQQDGHEMNEREMDLEDLITSRSGDVLRLKAKADAAMPEMAKVWRDEARRAASDVARLVALREPATVAQMEAERGLS